MNGPQRTQSFTKKTKHGFPLWTSALPVVRGFTRSRQGLTADVHHRPRSRHKVRLANMVTRFFFLDHSADEVGQFFIRRATTHQLMYIVVPDGKQAGPDLSVGSDAYAAAMSAERVGNRGDDSDFTDAVVEAIAPRGFTASVRNHHQRPVLSHTLY